MTDLEMAQKAFNFSIDSILCCPNGEVNYLANTNSLPDEERDTRRKLDKSLDSSSGTLESDSSGDVDSVTSSTSSTTSGNHSGSLSDFIGAEEVAPTRWKKPRTIFTESQVSRLEERYKFHRYLPTDERADLAHELGLTNQQVKHWFQNRRMKEKRQKNSSATRQKPGPQFIQPIPPIQPLPGVQPMSVFQAVPPGHLMSPIQPFPFIRRPKLEAPTHSTSPNQYDSVHNNVSITSPGYSQLPTPSNLYSQLPPPSNLYSQLPPPSNLYYQHLPRPMPFYC